MRIGFFLYPGMTQLDFTGPYEVLSRLPGAEVKLMAMDSQPIRTELGLTLVPDTLATDVDALEVLMVPGGPAVNRVLECRESLNFLATVRTDYVTSVCTGALALGKAGLLKGYRATTHWCFLDLLSLVGATPVSERVVVDRNRFTGAGVTAGLEFGFTLARQLVGDEATRRIQAIIEYDPAPAPPLSPADREAVQRAVAPEYAERRRLLTSP